MISVKNLSICLLYGMLSTFQTLNSRYLFRTLGFDFYTFAFLVQRLLNIVLFMAILKVKIRWDAVKTIIPYSLFMCTTNILSSYCVTVLPLAAFMAFKKFIVFFILLIAIFFKLPHNFSNFQYSCIFMIVLGGILVGQRDILMGQFVGYVAALLYNVCEAGTLEYQSYMRRQKSYQPEQVMVMNSILSLPYYLVIITYQNYFDQMFSYFTLKTTTYFYISFALLLVLACLSQFTASYIAMKISPFEKATVSNIKDILLTFISVYYFQDFALSLISQIGILFCLVASVIFSYTLLNRNQQKSLEVRIPIEAFDQEELTMESQQIKHDNQLINGTKQANIQQVNLKIDRQQQMMDNYYQTGQKINQSS